MKRREEILKNLLLFLLLLLNEVCVYSQTESSPNDAEKVEASLNWTAEAESRVGCALAAFEKMVQAGKFVSSITEIIRDKSIPLPAGVKSKTYTICIEEIYGDSLADGQRKYIKAICVIPIPGGKSLAFEGTARIEGDNGVGTQGTLELIAPIEKKLGKEGSIVFREGTSLTFGCDGFQEVDANMAFILKSDKVYSIDKDGHNTGKLMFEARTRFSDIEDFSVELNTEKNFCFDGLDGFTFSLNNLVLDHSAYSTPVTADFPSGYFGGADAEESRKQWQGLAINKAKVTLPSYMAKDSTNGQKERPELELRNVLIDGSGFTGAVEAKDIISDSSIDPNSWAISINDFQLAIYRNVISGVGFGGKVNVPPLGANSMLDYKAAFDVEQRTFILQSTLGKKLDFPMLCAKLTLDETSTISLQMGNGGIYPTIKANGLLSVEAPIGKDTASNKLKLPDLRFEGMEISRDRFELGTAALTGKMETPSMAGFKLTLNDIKTVKSGSEQGLGLDAAVAVNDMFNGDAKMALYGDAQKWKFNKVKVDKIHVKYDSKSFSVEGGVEFRDGDEIYGKGFRGDLNFTLIDKFKIEAVGVFGHKDDYRYFLTDVFYETQPASGIKVAPALSFYGFGGGLYRHMQQAVKNSQSEFGKSLTGICYTPDKKVGMGFLARTKFSFIGSPSLFDADVTFEMQFNENWGVNFVQLRGNATMLSAAQQTDMLSGLKKSLEKVEKKSGNIVEFNKNSLEAKPDPEKKGALTATLGMKFDMENDVFTADMNAYLDVAGVLKGREANNRMGWASSYFSKDKWYTYIGTPNDRLGVKLLGIAEAGGYFMVGNNIPELPGIPSKVKSNLSDSYVQKLERRSDDGKLTEGKGLAFGADLSVEFNASLKPFYAHLGVGMGTELLMKKYSEAAHCKGRTGTIGIDGWYAQAQAWAWVDAAIGMKVKVFRKERKFDIIDASMAAYLHGAGPNPVYFTGAVGGKFSVLGGLVKGHCSFDFEIGEKCIIEGGSPFGEDVIEQLTPADKSGDVNVFIAPQLVLNIPADEEMTIEDDNGSKETYRIGIAEFSITNTETNTNAKYTTSKSEDRRIWTYDLDEPLESHKQYKAYAKVTFERKDGNKWVPVPDENGKPYFEEKTVEFTAGERPKYIMPEHIAYAYPADRQYNFLTQENKEAYVMVSKDYSYLFTTEKPEGFDQKVQFTTFDGKTIDAQFTHKKVSGVSGVKFEVDIPTENLNLANDQIYNMAIINVPQRKALANENIATDSVRMDTGNSSDIDITTHAAEGDLAVLEQTEIYSVDFRTSSYKTFGEKMEKMKISDAIEWQSYNSAKEYSMHANVLDKSAKVEAFDKMEYDKSNLDANLIKIIPDYENMQYYTEKIAPLLYENKDVESLVGDYNAPQALYVVTLNMSEEELTLLPRDIEVGAHSDFIYSTGSLNNMMQKYMNADYNEMLTHIANTYTQNGINTKSGVETLLKTDYLPRFIKGKYPIILRYTLPGKGIVTSEYTIDMNYEY
ncbi:MAG: hypothetical protein K6G73_00670 [Marinilabiliaceae bacterium]|nr:hypothetical protein [Marinilabiliaceae bacterium]